MGWNVYVTRKMPGAALQVLRERCETVEVYPEDGARPHEEFIRAVRGRGRLLRKVVTACQFCPPRIP